MKWIKFIANILIIFFLVILQISFISNWKFFSPFNLILSLTIFLSAKNLHFALFFGTTAGLFLDLFSPLPFGAFILNLNSVIFLTNFLIKNFFTQQSLLSIVILGLIGVSFYNLFFIAAVKIFYLIKITNINFTLEKIYFLNLLRQLAANSIFISFLFFLKRD